LNLPVTLAAGQSAGFSVTFNPQSGNSGSGAVSFTSDAGSLSVPLAANVVTAGSLTSTPGSLNFGNVAVGTPKTISETVTNSGGSSVSITQANISGTGFTLTGLSLPASLGAGQSTTFSVTFTPQSGGGASGSLAIGSNATNPTLNIPLSANVASAGVLSTSDSSLTFGSVQIGGSATQSETLTNSGGTSVTISQAKVSGTGFSATGLSLPMTLSPGQSFTFGTVFAPTTGGSASGSIAVTSDASNSTLNISLAGTAAVAGQLAVSPASLSFGSVTVGQSKSLTASLTASGSSITISNAGGSTSEFTISGISLPLTLKAGQSASFTVTFTPQSSGAATANGSFTSNASNSSLVEALGGTGVAAPQHSVALSWNASTSSVVGYNVYRSSDSGASFSIIAPMNADLTYIDSAVQAGKTYLYVTTAVDANGKESVKSNQTQAVIPTP
jgi:Abnormal spindle-like microcephaly-assoc'd, ASPM-SPD-2-Hydin